MSAKTKRAAGLLGFAALSYATLLFISIVEILDFSGLPKAAALFLLGLVGLSIGGAFRCEGERKPRHARRNGRKSNETVRGEQQYHPHAKTSREGKKRATGATARRGEARQWQI